MEAIERTAGRTRRVILEPGFTLKVSLKRRPQGPGEDVDVTSAAELRAMAGVDARPCSNLHRSKLALDEISALDPDL
jgi:hypothetical protein